MRTTIQIDDDLLQAVMDIAVSQKMSVGRVLSDLARQSLGFPEIRNGVPLMPRRPKGSSPLTMEIVNRLRDES